MALCNVHNPGGRVSVYNAGASKTAAPSSVKNREIVRAGVRLAAK